VRIVPVPRVVRCGSETLVLLFNIKSLYALRQTIHKIALTFGPVEQFTSYGTNTSSLDVPSADDGISIDPPEIFSANVYYQKTRSILNWMKKGHTLLRMTSLAPLRWMTDAGRSNGVIATTPLAL
jgi:hypothetical protein